MTATLRAVSAADALNAQCVREWKTASLRAGMQLPQLLVPLTRCTVAVDERIGTAGISRKFEVLVSASFYVERLNSEASSPLDADRLRAFVNLHEIGHVVLNHFGRLLDAGYAADLVNQAGDMAWNRLLKEAYDELVSRRVKPVFRLPEWVLLPPKDKWSWSADKLCAWLHAERMAEKPQQQDNDPGAGSPSANDSDDGQAPPQSDAMPGAGCGLGSPLFDETDDGIAAPLIAQVMAEANQVARHVGAGAGSVLIGELLAPEPPPCRWGTLIRQYAQQASSAGERCGRTYARAHRRSGMCSTLVPDWQKGSANIAVLLDTSASMPDATLAQACSELVSIQSEVPSTRIFLVAFDTKVQFAEWLGEDEDAESLRRACRGRGFTDAESAYERVSDEEEEFAFLLILTDGELRFPTLPDNCEDHVVGLMGTQYRGMLPDDAITHEIDAI